MQAFKNTNKSASTQKTQINVLAFKNTNKSASIQNHIYNAAGNYVERQTAGSQLCPLKT